MESQQGVPNTHTAMHMYIHIGRTNTLTHRHKHICFGMLSQSGHFELLQI